MFSNDQKDVIAVDLKVEKWISVDKCVRFPLLHCTFLKYDPKMRVV